MVGAGGWRRKCAPLPRTKQNCLPAVPALAPPKQKLLDSNQNKTDLHYLPSLSAGGLAAFSALPAGYLGWLIVALGGVDFHMARDYSGNPEFPGDIRNGLQHLPENCRSGGLQLWENYSAEEKLSKRAIELNNGRAAMMGILALMVHEKLGNLDLILPFGAPGNF